MEKLLTRKNLLNFSLIVLFYHVSMTLIPWFEFIFPMYIADYILLGLTAAGWILHFAQRETRTRPKPIMIILTAFMVWLVISCVVMTIRYDNDWVSYNFAPSASSPVSPGMNAAVSLLFVFPLGIALAKEKAKPKESEQEKNSEKEKDTLKLGKILLHTFLLIWTAWITIVLITIFTGNTLHTTSGGTIGMVNNNLQLNGHYNIAGSWEMTFFLLCCFMAIQSKSRAWKCVYIASTLIHFIALMLTNSRASIYAAWPGFVALMGILAFLKTNKFKTPKRLLWALAAAAVAAAAYYLLRKGVYALYGTCIQQQYTGERKFFDYYGTLFTGRETIWKYTIKGLFSDPYITIFGVSPKSTRDLFVQASNGALSDSYTHNQFLEVAAAMGLPGLALFLSWGSFIARDTWKMYFTEKRWTILLCLPVIFVALLAANMMEAHLLFCEHMNGYVFFLLGGMIYGAMNGEAKKQELLSEPEGETPCTKETHKAG